MAVISSSVETLYDKGDIVIFDYHGQLMVGSIVGYAVDHGSSICVWYNILINKSTTLNYVNGGDVMESDILGKITDENLLSKTLQFLVHGEWESDD